MLIIPAIDLLGGKCVRLYKGQYDRSQVYSEDPVSMALFFQKAGARLIHLVDLDAARGEGKNNRDQIAAIVKAVQVDVEVGGGIRNEADVEALIQIGVKRLILGTILIKSPQKVAAWIKRYPEVDFIAGIDALGGEVKVNGWEEGSGKKDYQLAIEAKEMGIKALIYTNISRDGTLEGPDVENSLRVAHACGLPLIISGGVGGLDDLEQIAQKNESLFWGVISGKAYYEGRLDLKKAFELYQKK